MNHKIEAQPEPIITYENLEREFADVGERLEEDLSSVALTYTMDVHYGSCDLELFVYGRVVSDDDSPVVHLVVPECRLRHISGVTGGGLSHQIIRTLFDVPTQALLYIGHIMIQWNQGGLTGVEIDIGHVDHRVKYLPEEQ